MPGPLNRMCRDRAGGRREPAGEPPPSSHQETGNPASLVSGADPGHSADRNPQGSRRCDPGHSSHDPESGSWGRRAEIALEEGTTMSMALSAAGTTMSTM